MRGGGVRDGFRIRGAPLFWGAFGGLRFGGLSGLRLGFRI